MERLPVLWGGGEDNGWMKGKGYADEEDRVVNSKHSPSLDFAIRNFVSVEPLYIQISERQAATVKIPTNAIPA